MTAAFPIRIHAVRLKRKSRYRSPDAFNLKTSALLRSLQTLSSYSKSVGKGE